MTRTFACVLTTGMLFLVQQSAFGAITIGSFDGTRSSRPFTGSDYDNIRADLLNPANFGPAGIDTDTVTILPGVPTANAAALAGVNVFVLSEVSSLSGAEITELTSFVLSGNRLILVTNSGAADRFGANALLQALDGGSITDPTGGDQGSAVGSFSASTTATNGPFGNLVGGSFAASIASSLIAGSNSTIIGATEGGTFDVILQISAGALGPGSGSVLAMSDVLAMDFFVPPADLAPGNVNNSNLIMNFLSDGADDNPNAVPEPSTAALLAVGLLSLGLVAWQQRRRSFVQTH